MAPTSPFISGAALGNPVRNVVPPPGEPFAAHPVPAFTEDGGPTVPIEPAAVFTCGRIDRNSPAWLATTDRSVSTQIAATKRVAARDRCHSSRDGRSIVASTGAQLTEKIYSKQSNRHNSGRGRDCVSSSPESRPAVAYRSPALAPYGCRSTLKGGPHVSGWDSAHRLGPLPRGRRVSRGPRDQVNPHPHVLQGTRPAHGSERV